MNIAARAAPRKCLLVVAQGSFKAKKLVAYLEQMVVAHGKPEYIRCDNGGAPLRPELISVTMVKFGFKHGIEIRYTQPGKPMQNGLVERLNAGPPVRYDSNRVPEPAGFSNHQPGSGSVGCVVATI